MNYTYKHIWLINFPVMMSILIEQLINITDAIFLGHVGEIELGASALAVIFYRPIIGIYTESTALMQIAHLPFVVMLLNYIFALPGYVYMNSVTGTGATRMTFIFQLITIVAYQIYLWSISSFSTSLSVYWTAEYLYVILLGLLSVIYLKYKHY